MYSFIYLQYNLIRVHALKLYFFIYTNLYTGQVKQVLHSLVIVMKELHRPFLFPGGYTLRKCVHGCTHIWDTKEEVSSEYKNFGYSLSGDNSYHPRRDTDSRLKIWLMLQTLKENLIRRICNLGINVKIILF